MQFLYDFKCGNCHHRNLPRKKRKIRRALAIRRIFLSGRSRFGHLAVADIGIGVVRLHRSDGFLPSLPLLSFDFHQIVVLDREVIGVELEFTADRFIGFSIAAMSAGLSQIAFHGRQRGVEHLRGIDA